MALSNSILETILELKNRGYFDNKKSVIDMGDQDVNVKFDDLIELLKQSNVNFDESEFDLAKKFPLRPRISSSQLWKTIGFDTANRIDIIEIEREKKIGHVIKHDLNFPFNDKNHLKKYDLVTDFGNNEHPFNVFETYRTMHNLCALEGNLLIFNSIFGGNGFYNFDLSYFENIAAVNNYSIIFSKLFFIKDKKYITTPVDKELIKLINLNNIENIYAFYLMRKKSDNEFKMPYQGFGSSFPPKEKYNLQSINKYISPEKYYIPTKASTMSGRELLKLLIKKIIKR
tara:strand:+ start:568 stop:1425 length:858 start_codon:yes stop_codon:yes gene_type:complete